MKYWNESLRITHGCTPVNGGCAHCWAAAMTNMRQYNPLVAKRYKGLLASPAEGFSPRFNGTVRVHDENISDLLLKKKPRVWQVWNDLFHEAVPDGTIRAVFHAASIKQEQTLIVLTKRHKRLFEMSHRMDIPENVYVGVSISGFMDAVDPLEYLVNTRAKRKVISYEPVVSEVDLSRALLDTAIKVVLVGGETGPKLHVRDCPQDAVWQCKNQCEDAGAMFFFKQWGSRRAGRTLAGRTWDDLPWSL